MTRFFSSWTKVTNVVAVLVVLCASVGPINGAIASGPFEDFSGSWNGSGTITLANGTKERLRCRAGYQVRSSRANDLNLSLNCSSDSYKFNFTGNVNADESGQITGRWTETTRGVGGTIIGRARGQRIQVLVESSGFSAELVLVTRGGRQSVSIRSRAGGESATASISLRRH